MNHAFFDLDWLSFTYKFDKKIEMYPGSMLPTFLEKFPELESDFFESPIKSHYKNTMSNNDGILFAFDDIQVSDADDNDRYFSHLEHGLNVQVQSSNLNKFFKYFGLDGNNHDDVIKMLELLTSRGCKISRIDLCYDDYTKKYVVHDYMKMFAIDCIQSPCQNIQFVGKDSTIHGMTMYVGSLKARKNLLRVYDKFLESKDDPDYKNCVRYEHEFHGTAAHDIVHHIITEGREGISFPNLLMKYFVVKNNIKGYDKDHQPIPYNKIGDAPIDKEWFEWLTTLNGDLTLCKIKVAHVDTPPKDSDAWIEKKVLGSLKGYILKYGLDSFNDIFARAPVSKTYLRELRKLSYSDEYITQEVYIQ